MAIPKSAYPPPFNVTRASHVVITSRDLGAARAFYVDMLGLIVSNEDADTLYLRGLEEACHHSLVIRRSDKIVCDRVGMRVYSEADLDAAFDTLSRRSVECVWAEVPHQGKTLHFSDAAGAPIELCARMDIKPRLVVAFDQFRAGAPHRLDHVQILTPDVQAAADFYTGIGFRLSEYVAVDGSDDLVFIFLQRKGNPHDIVFANGSGPRLHHFAIRCPMRVTSSMPATWPVAWGSARMSNTGLAATGRDMRSLYISAIRMGTGSNCSLRTISAWTSRMSPCAGTSHTWQTVPGVFRRGSAGMMKRLCSRELRRRIRSGAESLHPSSECFPTRNSYGPTMCEASSARSCGTSSNVPAAPKT